MRYHWAAIADYAQIEVNVPHRHAVMSLPDKLRLVLKEDRRLWVVMDSASVMLIDRLFKDYKNGFYVFAPKESRITSRHRVSKYVALVSEAV